MFVADALIVPVDLAKVVDQINKQSFQLRLHSLRDDSFLWLHLEFELVCFLTECWLLSLALPKFHLQLLHLGVGRPKELNFFLVVHKFGLEVVKLFLCLLWRWFQFLIRTIIAFRLLSRFWGLFLGRVVIEFLLGAFLVTHYQVDLLSELVFEVETSLVFVGVVWSEIVVEMLRS